MKATRRTMLKSAAGLALAASLPGSVRWRSASAQSPRYELIDLVSFTESIDVSGTPYFGGLTGLTVDGRVYGSLAEGDLLVPKIWATSGESTPLPLGDSTGINNLLRAFAADGVALVNQFPNGLSGVGIEVFLLDSAGDIITLAAPDENGGDLEPMAINDTGGVAGAYFSNVSSTGTDAIRWIAGIPETLGKPDGFSSARATTINATGDVAGDMLDAQLRMTPFVWTVDGAFQLLEVPVEYEGLDASVFFTNVNDINLDSDPLVRFVNSTGPIFQSGWYRQGTWEPLPALADGQNVNASSGNAAGMTIGAVIAGSDRTVTIWQEGEVLDLNELIAPGSGLVVTTASGINDNGEIVAMGNDAAGVHHGVLLKPIA